MDTINTTKIKCEICKENDYKYKCPACSLKTCSLKCCQEHKTLYSCNGQRDKTKFVKLQDFSERELLSDYHFLEEQSRLIDNTQRDTLKRKYDITSSMDYLKHLAFKQSKTVLQFMPRHSSKRLANKTRFDKTTKNINWHLELKFLPDRVFALNELCSSKDTIKDILIRFYKDNEFSLFLNDQVLNSYQVGFKSLVDGGGEDLSVLFEMRNFTLKCKYYVKFDLNKALEANLFKKTVIEYPVLNVVLKKDLVNFNIKNEEEVMREVHKRQNEDRIKEEEQMEKQVKAESKDVEKEEGECDDDDDKYDDNGDDMNLKDAEFENTEIEHQELFDETLSEDGEASEKENSDARNELKKQKFFTDEFELEFEFDDNLKKGFSEAGIKIEKI